MSRRATTPCSKYASPWPRVTSSSATLTTTSGTWSLDLPSPNCKGLTQLTTAMLRAQIPETEGRPGEAEHTGQEEGGRGPAGEHRVGGVRHGPSHEHHRTEEAQGTLSARTWIERAIDRSACALTCMLPVTAQPAHRKAGHVHESDQGTPQGTRQTHLQRHRRPIPTDVDQGQDYGDGHERS